ncbi:MAG TPA: cell wall hydrolase [Brevundimonas sp.]|jgi:hypothetical protein
MTSAYRPFAAALSALMLVASPATVLAQTSTAPTPAPTSANDAVAALLGEQEAPPTPELATPAATANAALEARGETNGPAPDSAQNPVELTITQRLNAEVVRRDEMADQTDRTNQAEYKAEVAEYKEAVADNQAERERIVIDAQINTQARAEYDADQESRYQKAMADWRATNAACERGDAARCRAGSMPARPGT